MDHLDRLVTLAGPQDRPGGLRPRPRARFAPARGPSDDTITGLGYETAVRPSPAPPTPRRAAGDDGEALERPETEQQRMVRRRPAAGVGVDGSAEPARAGPPTGTGVWDERPPAVVVGRPRGRDGDPLDGDALDGPLEEPAGGVAPEAAPAQSSSPPQRSEPVAARREGRTSGSEGAAVMRSRLVAPDDDGAAAEPPSSSGHAADVTPAPHAARSAAPAVGRRGAHADGPSAGGLHEVWSAAPRALDGTPAAAGSPGSQVPTDGATRPTQPPVVNVSVGRVEVVEAAPAAPTRPRPVPRLSLDDYLAGRR